MIELEPIGVAHTPYDDPEAAPPQPHDQGEQCVIIVDRRWRDGLTGLDEAGRVTVVMWFDRADREAPLQQVSRTHPEWGEVGVFALRSPHRPNPIGVSTVPVVDCAPSTGRLTVRGLDCLTGTPVLDLKRG